MFHSIIKLSLPAEASKFPSLETLMKLIELSWPIKVFIFILFLKSHILIVLSLLADINSLSSEEKITLFTLYLCPSIVSTVFQFVVSQIFIDLFSLPAIKNRPLFEKFTDLKTELETPYRV